jgi:hypothetical protein
MNDETLQVLFRAKNADLWQEKDGTTREYDHQHFGYSDYIRDLTRPANAAAEAGLIELRGAWRRWAPTDKGLELLARAEQESQR